MSDEWTDKSMRITFFSVDSSEVCSGIVILGLVLSLVFAQKGKTTDLNTSSMYTRPIKFTSIITKSVVLGFKHLYLPRDLANVNVWKPIFALLTEFLRKIEWRPVHFDMDLLSWYGRYRPRQSVIIKKNGHIILLWNLKVFKCFRSFIITPQTQFP